MGVGAVGATGLSVECTKLRAVGVGVDVGAGELVPTLPVEEEGVVPCPGLGVGVDEPVPTLPLPLEEAGAEGCVGACAAEPTPTVPFPTRVLAVVVEEGLGPDTGVGAGVGVGELVPACVRVCVSGALGPILGASGFEVPDPFFRAGDDFGFCDTCACVVVVLPPPPTAPPPSFPLPLLTLAFLGAFCAVVVSSLPPSVSVAPSTFFLFFSGFGAAEELVVVVVVVGGSDDCTCCALAGVTSGACVWSPLKGPTAWPVLVVSVVEVAVVGGTGARKAALVCCAFPSETPFSFARVCAPERDPGAVLSTLPTTTAFALPASSTGGTPEVVFVASSLPTETGRVFSASLWVPEGAVVVAWGRTGTLRRTLVKACARVSLLPLPLAGRGGGKGGTPPRSPTSRPDVVATPAQAGALTELCSVCGSCCFC